MLRHGVQVTVYEHSAWNGYLLPAIAPGARRLTVVIGERSRDVLDRVSDECEIFVFHVNLTLSARTPVDRSALVVALRARGIQVVNGGLVDISKHALRQVCSSSGLASLAASADGDPEERLLIKTTYNYHGFAERELSIDERAVVGYPSPEDIPLEQDAEYRVVQRRDVPDGLWTSPHWVVERYVTNAEHRFHRVYIAGDAMAVSRVFDPSVFKKMPEGIERDTYQTQLCRAHDWVTAPPDVRKVASMSARAAKAALVDYGAFDVVSDDDGNCYLIDINTTPYWGDGGQAELLGYLGAGLVASRHAS